MARHMPRPIKPELIEPGDFLEVEYPESGGITVLKRGTVERIEVHGANRHIVTSEGSVLASYYPGMKTGAKFLLIRRSYGGELLEMFADAGRL